ncbi:DNA-binding transcriptional MerR regulator [Nonomuraea muscovyensis]|uniref:DNA-binding transcriptional MerR regulator n=1 Tax=Nonomuraea muscovyensis TaxID=1124761 RepID=A0A7X0EXR9_9ACTN|nr:MerR family transcriptional regulator [Nonomuraea muscovyensis]MBB6347913.1 DNA-binding transcriptional MerR regulator [Nonomuraea muscovyensis]
MVGGVTIGQAAAFANITIKTIRHYHQLGLVDEPHRDSSGYRRYSSSDLLRLVQVRTLAESGVPLSEISALLDADPQRFAADLAEVKRRLTERIEELITRRDLLDRLANGDRTLLPDRACALLDRAAGLGFTSDEVAAYREGMVLTRALIPDGFDDYLTKAEHALDDTRFVDLNKQCWAAKDLDPDDPRIKELATALADRFLANPALLAIPNGLQARTDATRYGLLNHHGEDQAPAMARLTTLVEAKLRSAGVDIPHQ